MEQIINYSTTILNSIIALVILYLIWMGSKFAKRGFYIKKFTDYMAILEYHMNKAYDIIHKDRILIYSLEATRIPDQQFEVITHDFVNLVRKFIGPALQKDLIQFYGNEDTFIFNIVEYFNTRYEEDSIRKQTLDEISSEQMSEVSKYEQGPRT